VSSQGRENGGSCGMHFRDSSVDIVIVEDKCFVESLSDRKSIIQLEFDWIISISLLHIGKRLYNLFFLLMERMIKSILLLFCLLLALSIEGQI
jgi:hypothetical protein